MASCAFPISVHRNCEILSMTEREASNYELQIKLTTSDKEYVPRTFSIRGEISQIAKVLKLFGERYSDETLFSKTFGHRPCFQIEGNRLFVENEFGRKFSMDIPNVDVERIVSIFTRTSSQSEQIKTQEKKQRNWSKTGVEGILESWSEINMNRSLSSTQRTSLKIVSIHEFVHKLGKERGIGQADLETATANLSEVKDPVTLLARYRLLYFGKEIGAELIALEASDHVQSRLRTISH
jgi:hypothetical protein